MSRVLPPDLEAWLVGHLRGELAASGVDVEVDNKEPAALGVPLEVPLVVVRDDSGPAESVVTFRRQVGVSVLAGTRQDDGPSRALARLVMAVLTDDAIVLAPGSPVAAVAREDVRGPYPVDDDQDVARRYLTVGYTVVGSW